MCDPGKITDNRATVFASLMGELKATYENELLLIGEGGIRQRGVCEEWILRMLRFAGYTAPEEKKPKEGER